MSALGLLDVVTLLSVLGCALIGGVFFAFSSFVMGALGALPPAHGAAAMQSINVVVLNPTFLAPFVGTAATCGLLVVAALLRWDDPRAAWWLAGGLLYVVGTFGVTMLFNVPRNNRLAAVAAESSEAVPVWLEYLTSWTMWNTVRTVAALAAALALMFGFRVRA